MCTKTNIRNGLPLHKYCTTFLTYLLSDYTIQPQNICNGLHFQTCSCGHFQGNVIPCSHGFTIIQTLQSNIPEHPKPRDYVPYYFTTMVWQYTYLSNLRPISLDLVKSNCYRITDSNPIVAPTAKRKAMGQPKVKHIIVRELQKNVFQI